MQHPDEGMIHTWLDGELAPDDASSLEAHVAECPECSAKVAEARGLVAASSRIVSALDLVPGGVIPIAAPKRRAWYTGTQFRAAAAVMIVAAASLVVVRDRDKAATMERVMSAPTSQIAEDAAASAIPAQPRPMNVSSDRSSAESTPAVVAPTVRSGTARRVEEAESSRPPAPVAVPQANAADALSGKVAGVQLENDLAAPRADSTTRRSMASVPADRLMRRGVMGGVARGVELGANVAQLRRVRSDSTQARNQTVFEVSPGVEVTLTDVAAAASESRLKQQAVVTGVAVAPLQAPPAASTAQRDESKPVPVNTISWVDKRGHLMTLAGPLPKDQLEQLRQRLPEDQR
jgi:hypothetical protein